jgi:hypothetical protein
MLFYRGLRKEELLFPEGVHEEDPGSPELDYSHPFLGAYSSNYNSCSWSPYYSIILAGAPPPYNSSGP